jgi:hypothetical protein
VKGGRLTGAVVGGAVALALVFAPAAQARPASISAQLSLKGSNGYRIFVTGQRGPDGIVIGKARRAAAGRRLAEKRSGLGPGLARHARSLLRQRPHSSKGLFGSGSSVTVEVGRGLSASDYTVPGIVNSKRIQGGFGKFGHIDVRFHVRKERKFRFEPDCTPIREQIGIFKGRIHFRGEQGYTQVDSRRSKGRVFFPHPVHCDGGGGGGGGGGDHGTELLAQKGSTLFDVDKPKGIPIVFFLALTDAQKRQVLIDRFAFRFADKSEFTFDQGLTTAHVEPGGSAFSGAADFTAPHDWLGPLTRSFPGAPDLPLAGPDFTARLRHY